MTGCVSSRTATSERLQLTAYSLQDTVREQVVVTVFDTITITKTITIRESESGDTLRVSTVTERDHVRDRSQLKVKSEKLKVETDTVFIEKDSLVVKEIPHQVRNEGNGGLFGRDRSTGHTGLIAGLTRNLRWLFFVLLAIIAIIILIRLTAKR